MKRFLFFLLVFVFLPLHASAQENWQKIGNNINNAFFFVVDKIIELQSFFIGQALFIGKLVLLIAVFSAAFNYALTGSGLKENIIKILKATVFFLIVIFAYPNIIGGITKWTFDMARESIYPSVASYFAGITNKYDYDFVDYSPDGRSHIQTTVYEIIKQDNSRVFDGLLADRRTPRMNYTAVAPASVIKIIFFLASDCFSYAENSTKRFQLIPEVRRYVVGIPCAFAIIFTGIFALLEYLVCFLEFMLVSTVGVILFPLSIWEGSKFMAEKFIGAILGFFMKLLFCNIAIFLLIYGFVSMFYFFSGDGFQGTVDQIIFIFFICLMFFYICKSAPGLAQALLTGTPSLSAAGAISAVTGAVAAAGATVGLAAKPAGLLARGTTNAVVGGIGDFKEANAARNAVKDAGGTKAQQAGAFMKSLAGSAGDHAKAGALSLTRSLMGVKNNGSNPHSWRESLHNEKNEKGENKSFHEHFNDRREEGAIRGKAYAAKHNIGSAGKTEQLASPPNKQPAGTPPAQS